MGQEIHHVAFTEDDFTHFHDALHQETDILKSWFDNCSFESGAHACGIELEAWLVTEDFLPSPTNTTFLSALNHQAVTHELAQFNVELNSQPHSFKENMLTNIEQELKQLWSISSKCARQQGGHLTMIGSLPTLDPHFLTQDYLSPLERYKAINQQIKNFRYNNSLLVEIKGRDEILSMHIQDVMLESAATSLQIHLQVNPDEAVRFYNAAHIASSFMVAAGANSPYLLGKSLWDETRIAVFEQAVSLFSIPKKQGKPVGRVTFGSSYAHDSLFELFIENLEGYPILLPDMSGEAPNHLSNVRLHNGSIWRWNRPLIGFGDSGLPHLRIEHRVLSSGPTILDIMANITLFLGLVHYFASMDEPPEQVLPFESAVHNFYHAARFGLDAEIIWLDGQHYPIMPLLRDTLLPKAGQALLNLGISKQDVDTYLRDVMYHRLSSGRNGAFWQKEYIAQYGRNFQHMMESYIRQQEQGKPVHEWSV